MENITISKFKATCLELLRKVKQTGQPLLITRAGEPIAMIVSPPLPKRESSWIGCMQSTGKIVDDITSPAADSSEWEVLGQ